MCRLFSVTPSNYYSWVKNGCIVEKIDKEFNTLLQKLLEEARSTYGTRRLKVVLQKCYGLIVSRRKIQKSLHQLKLKVKMKRRYKVLTTTSDHKLPISPNHIDRDFYTNNSNKVYVGDITYVLTNEGWLSLFGSCYRYLL